jgi:hypothetical protein
VDVKRVDGKKRKLKVKGLDGKVKLLVELPLMRDWDRKWEGK